MLVVPYIHRQNRIRVSCGRVCAATHNPIKNNTVCAAVALSLDHVALGLREARLYSAGPLLRCIVRTAMKRLTYNNHTDIQDELRDARPSYMLHTAVSRVYMCDLSGNAAVNPPLRHGREVTRVNEWSELQLSRLSWPRLSATQNASRVLQEMVAKAGLTFDCLHIFDGFSKVCWNSSSNTVR